MSEDPYYYPGTDVLINRKNIRDKAQLERFETGSAQLQTARADTLKGLSI
jgi:fido (protein-threonine AMPylation protein)